MNDLTGKLTASLALKPSPDPAGVDTVELYITNHSPDVVEILNPFMGRPMEQMKWPYSQATFQTAVLISYNYLHLTVQELSGEEVVQQVISPWVTPNIYPRLQLAQGDSFSIDIPIGDFYELAPGETYRISVRYGDKDLTVHAHATISIP